MATVHFRQKKSFFSICRTTTAASCDSLAWRVARGTTPTSLGGGVLEPRAAWRRAHVVAAGDTEVVGGQGLQSGDLTLEGGHRGVDETGVHHLAPSPAHFFNLGMRGVSRA